MTHRAVEVSRRWFTQKSLPHWAMGLLSVTWLFFQMTLGSEGVPGPLNQGWAACLGLWFGYILQQGNVKEVRAVDERVDRLSEFAEKAHPNMRTEHD